MADINIAFGSPFTNSCSLSFDVTSVLNETPNGVNCKWMGLVTINSLVGTLQQFGYEVFSTESDSTAPFPFPRFFPVSNDSSTTIPITFGQSDRKVVTRGTVTNSNNMIFTFPITSPTIDYFVLVTPMFNQSVSQSHPNNRFREGLPEDLRNTELRAETLRHTDIGTGTVKAQEFGIFYTSRLIKKRKEIARKTKSRKERSTHEKTTIVVPSNEEAELSSATPIGANNVFEVPEFAAAYPFPGMDETAKRDFVAHFSAAPTDEWMPELPVPIFSDGWVRVADENLVVDEPNWLNGKSFREMVFGSPEQRKIGLP